MDEMRFDTVSYRSGTYVYVEEQVESGEFYIIRSGKLEEENPLNELTGEPDMVMKAGDFFGVLECMSHRAHVSSLRALEDSQLIVVRNAQFETLIKQMAPIAMKIIRHFSHRLRKYNDTISRLTFNNNVFIPSNLLAMAEYYKDNGQPLLAGYAYSKYMKQSPDADIEKTKAEINNLRYNPEAVAPRKTGIQENYTPGTPIFMENEEGKTLYIVLEGQVKITRIVGNREILLGIMKSKDIFGEMAIIDDSPRSATAIALGEVSVLAVSKDDCEDYVQKHPKIARRIIELLSDRIWLINKRLANQLISDPVTKIYAAFQTLLQKNRIPLQKGLQYTFEMGSEQLAQFIGLEPNEGTVMVNRIVNTDPTLELKDGKIHSRDVYAIRSATTLSGRAAVVPKKRTK